MSVLLFIVFNGNKRHILKWWLKKKKKKKMFIQMILEATKASARKKKSSIHFVPTKHLTIYFVNYKYNSHFKEKSK